MRHLLPLGLPPTRVDTLRCAHEGSEGLVACGTCGDGRALCRTARMAKVWQGGTGGQGKDGEGAAYPAPLPLPTRRRRRRRWQWGRRRGRPRRWRRQRRRHQPLPHTPAPMLGITADEMMPDPTRHRRHQRCRRGEGGLDGGPVRPRSSSRSPRRWQMGCGQRGRSRDGRVRVGAGRRAARGIWGGSSARMASRCTASGWTSGRKRGGACIGCASATRNAPPAPAVPRRGVSHRRAPAASPRLRCSRPRRPAAAAALPRRRLHRHRQQGADGGRRRHAGDGRPRGGGGHGPPRRSSRAPPAGKRGGTDARAVGVTRRAPSAGAGPCVRNGRRPPRLRPALLGVRLPVPPAPRRPWPATAGERLVSGGRRPRWRVRGGRVAARARGRVWRVARVRRGAGGGAGGDRGGESRAAGGPQRGRRKGAARCPEFVDLSGAWRGRAWPAATAATVVAASLALTDTVVGVQPGYGCLDVLPAVEYGHQPVVQSAAQMAEAVALGGGHVLRVVYR